MRADVFVLTRAHGVGAAFLLMATVGVFGSGLAVQLLAVRWLDPSEYARFVFAVGLGNAAATVGTAITPVIVLGVAEGVARPLPTQPRTLVLGGMTVGALIVVALGTRTDPLVVALAVAQVPLVVLAAIGAGGLQAEIRFGAMAGVTGAWALTRLLAAGSLASVFARSDRYFVLGLTVALACQTGVMRWLGAFRRTEWRPSPAAGALVHRYALWLVFGWMMNADAVFGPILLAGAEAGDLALALTLGRQAVFLAAPLSFVVLPIALAQSRGTRRRLLYGSLGLAAAIGLATGAVLIPAPGAIAELIRPDGPAMDTSLIRSYAAVGAASALAMLLFTLAAGWRALPPLRALGVMATLHSVGLVALGGTSHGVALSQLVAVCGLGAWLLWIDLRESAQGAE